MPEARSSVNKNRRDRSERKTEGGEGRRGREKDERRRDAKEREHRETVGRLLTSMHLLTCSNGHRYFCIKLTAGDRVTHGVLALLLFKSLTVQLRSKCRVTVRSLAFSSRRESTSGLVRKRGFFPSGGREIIRVDRRQSPRPGNEASRDDAGG